MHLEIIAGISLFDSNCQIIGVALPGEEHAMGACKAAERASTTRGRPAGTESLSGFSEQDTIDCLARRWQEWAEHNHVQLTINLQPRRVGAF